MTKMNKEKIMESAFCPLITLDNENVMNLDTNVNIEIMSAEDVSEKTKLTDEEMAAVRDFLKKLTSGIRI